MGNKRKPFVNQSMVLLNGLDYVKPWHPPFWANDFNYSVGGSSNLLNGFENKLGNLNYIILENFFLQLVTDKLLQGKEAALCSLSFVTREGVSSHSL